MGTAIDIGSYLGVVFPALAVLCIGIVYTYAERDNHFPWHTYITIAICYFASLGILLVVPIDLGTTITDRMSTVSGSDPTFSGNTRTLTKAYSTFFVIIIVFAQIVMVWEEYYNCDGHFTLFSRAASSFGYMVRDLLLVAVVGAIVLGILIKQEVVEGTADSLQLTAVICTNVLYELFLMFLLGYGLVEFPRRFWLNANIDNYLLRTQIKAASDFADIRESQVNMSIEFANAMKTMSKLEQTPGHSKELADAMQIIMTELPPDGFNATRSGEVALDSKLKPPQISIRSLSQLRYRINVARSQYRMALAKVEKTKLLAYHLEDLVAAKARNEPSSPTFDGVPKIHWSISDTMSSTVQYHWHIKYRPWLLRAVAVAWALLSILSFIGVCCSFSGVDVTRTPYFQAVHTRTTTGGVVIFCFITFGYTIYITLWSLFQMKMGGLMDLVVGETTPLSLSFNARMIARLAAPLAFFYMGWLAENGCTLQDETWIYNNAPVNPIKMPSSFSNFYQLQTIPFIKKSFGTIYPSILIAFLFLVVSDAYNWVCVKCGATWAQFGVPRVTAEQEREGKRRLVDDKKKTLSAARRKRMLSVLLAGRPAAGTNDDGDDGGLATGGAAGGAGILGFFFGGGKSASLADSEQPSSVSEPRGAARTGGSAPTPRDITPPSDLGGMLEMKSAGRVFSSWKDWWAEVRAPGVVYFFSNRVPPPNFIDAAAPPPVELIDVIDFKIEGGTLLHLCTPDGQVTLRFKSSVECDTWRRLLIEWKDFSVDHGREYMLRNSPAANAVRVFGSGAFSRDAEKGFSSASFGGGTKPSRYAPPAAVSSSSSSSLNLGEEKPSPLECFVEMKSTTGGGGGGGLLGGSKGGGWERRFVRVDERSSSLVVTKSSSPGEKPLLSISLPEVADIAASREFGASYVDVQLDETTVYKLRASSDAEGNKLSQALNAWREFFLLNFAG